MSNLSGKDVVVHLAGEPISKPLGGMIPLPWTKWKRNEILKSRVEGTKLISEHCFAKQPSKSNDLCVCCWILWR